MKPITHDDPYEPPKGHPKERPEKCPHCGADPTAFYESYGIGFGICGLTTFCTCGKIVAQDPDDDD